MTGTLINRPLIKYVGIAAAIVGIFEALVWLFLSLISILYYHNVLKISIDIVPVSYEFVLHTIFLNADSTNEDVIITTKIFNIFMYVYFVLSILWLLTSINMLWVMNREKWKNSATIIGGWSLLTIVISVIDIIVMSLLASDCVTMQDLLDDIFNSINLQQSVLTSTQDPITSVTTNIETITITTSTLLSSFSEYFQLFATDDPDVLSYANVVIRQIINTCYFIGISLAAKFYILLVMNLVFAIILAKFAVALSKEAKKSLLPLIDSYSAGGPPWPNNLYEETDIGNGYSNNAYVPDNDREVFPRSDSFIGGETDLKNQNPLSNGANPYAQQIEKLRPISSNPNVVSPKLAKIGKQNGRRTPPRNVPPPNIPFSNSPYIPDPDYSPPGSPVQPKSVLRPRSNYVL